LAGSPGTVAVVSGTLNMPPVLFHDGISEADFHDGISGHE
jgi:hypothetical protein